MTNTNNEALCPLCHKENGCMAGGLERCWCHDVTVPQALLDLVPEPLRNQACICRSCIEKFTSS